MDRDALRRLPPVGAVLEHDLLAESVDAQGRVAVLRGTGGTRGSAARLARGREVAADPASLARRSRAILEGEKPTLRPVINATGVLLHTGLGRAPLADGGDRGRRRGGSGLLQPRVRPGERRARAPRRRGSPGCSAS